MIDIHFICPNGDHIKKIEMAPDKKSATFRSGFWTVSTEKAQEAVGGNIFLHSNQSAEAWHGGRVTGWEMSDDPQFKNKIVFTYIFTGAPKVKCPGSWGQEKCIVKRDDHDGGAR